MAVRFADLAAFEQLAQVRGGGDLAAMRARGMDALVESCRCSEQGFERHGSGEIGELGHAEGARRAQAAHGCGHGLGAIEQRESFLGFEVNGAMPASRRAQRPDALALVEDFAFADQGEGEVGERREVAAGADRALDGMTG